MALLRPRAERVRKLPVVLIAVLLAASACTSDGPELRVGPTLMQMARSVGSDVVRALVQGYVPHRSGEILLVPEPWNVLGNWNGGVRGSGDPRTTHSTPWEYHQRVPISLYGPGYIRSGRKVDRPASVADIAPTLAELLRMPFESQGEVLREALVPERERPDPPRAIVVVVVDGGGWNVLERWPRSWPSERTLMERGTTFTNATVGSAPSVTAPIHATIGTGRYPAQHGISENSLRLPDGDLGDAVLDDGDLSLLRKPTFADAWDESTANRAWVGMIGYEGWHLGMMGSGAMHEGADSDLAILWDQKEGAFWTNPKFYEDLPTYLPGLSVLSEVIRDSDSSDGAIDGRWRGYTLDPTSYQFSAGPAFATYQRAAAVEILRQEPIGQDAIPDLYFAELKTGDIAGHVWNMTSGRFETVWRTQDRTIGAIVDELDRRVGRGRYVVAVTADHGQSPMPEEADGLRLDRFVLNDNLNALFGGIETVQPSDVFLETEALEDADLEAMARHIGGLTFGDVIPDGLDRSDVPVELLAVRVFAAALPGPFLASLSEAEIDALGPGRYPEGDLTSAPRGLPI
ncbi:MAG: alkaline phosphatase family protein [Actinomycetota bacterium]